MRLNLGSGQRPFGPGWTNIDISERWSPDIVADAANLHMIPDGSVEMIVGHHIIEHVGLGEFDGAIRECYRVLQPGGSLILTTPDLYVLSRAWIDGKINDYIFCVNLYGAYMGDEADRHKWLYTPRTLCQAVGKPVQWSSIKEFDWRPIEGADIAKDWYIQGIECVK